MSSLNFDYKSGFSTINGDNFLGNQFYKAPNSNISFNSGNGNDLINSQIFPDYYTSSSPNVVNVENLACNLNAINLDSNSNLNFGSGYNFMGNQTNPNLYHPYNQHAATFLTETSIPFDHQLYDPKYHIPYTNNSHCLPIIPAQYPTPSAEPVFQNPLDINYIGKQTERKLRRRPRAPKEGNGELQTKVCENCSVTETPTWRRDNAKNKLLCNACGLHEKNHCEPRKTFKDENGTVKLAKRRGSKNGKPVKGAIIKCAMCSEAFSKYFNPGDALAQLCTKCKLVAA